MTGPLVFVLVIGLLIYFLPAIVAAGREHPSALAIFFLNLLLGWSLVGWVVALVWGLTQPARPIVVTSPSPERTDPRRPCPFCAEAIVSAARICRFCGRELPPNWTQSGTTAAPDKGSA